MPNCPKGTRLIFFLGAVALLIGCAGQPISDSQQSKTNPSKAASVNPQAPFTFSNVPSPVPNDAVDQRVIARPDGSVVLSWWQNTAKDKPTFLIAEFADGKWTTPTKVTDMAGIIEANVMPVGNDALAALWMVSKPAKNGDGEAHEIYTSRADKQGQGWTKPLRLNQEAVTSMKESPTLATMPDGTLLSAWIDMRNFHTIPPSKPGAEATSEGFTSLMVASVSPDNKSVKEMLVDKDFCECCPPSIAANAQGGLLAYREHQEGNVRDPAVMPISVNNFGQSSIVHPDHWVLDGCPSKAPAIAEIDNTVGVAWLTSIKDKPRIRVAFSTDNGKHFSQPIELEPENAGSVNGITMESPTSALVAWTVTGSQGETAKIARVHTDGRIERRTTVHSLTDGKAYKWPGPHIAKTGENVYLTWNDEQAKKLGVIKVKVD